MTLRKNILSLAFLTLLVPSILNAKESKLIKFLKNFEFGLSAGVKHNFKNPAQDYLKGVNQNFKDGKYTFTTPIPQWKDISVSNPKEYPVEASILYKLKWPTKTTKIGLVGNYSSSEIKSDYNESYNVWDFVSKGGISIPSNFKRKENIDISSKAIGVKVKTDLLKFLTASLTGKYNNYDVNGKVDYALHRLDLDLKQFRKANYKGEDTGLSFELGLDFNITKNIFVGIAIGHRNGKVKTKGEEEITLDYVPDWSLTEDYSPEFNFNSSYGKINLGIRF